ncbi:MAG: ROK family protein [Methylococcales bacterium]|nr:ROK family protein [Methylococcales bacterium]
MLSLNIGRSEGFASGEHESGRVMIRLGVDLGGTKIEIVAIDPEGRELLRNRVPTPKDDYQAILAAVVGLVHAAEHSLGLQGTVGICLPGALSKKNGYLKNSNSLVLNARPVGEDLRSVLGREVRLSNDADCFTLSEAVDGVAVGAQIVFGVILGTGVGGGIVVGGKLLSGPNSIAGEWGHNPLPWLKESDHPLPDCYCGHAGCIETYLSGPGFAALHQVRHDRVMTAAELVVASQSGDGAARASLEEYEHRLARALAQVINIIDPDVIVLGGGLSNCRRLYDTVPRIWSEFIFSDQVDTLLVPPQHGDSSGVRGAAKLWDSA